MTESSFRRFCDLLDVFKHRLNELDESFGEIIPYVSYDQFCRLVSIPYSVSNKTIIDGVKMCIDLVCDDEKWHEIEENYRSSHKYRLYIHNTLNDIRDMLTL